MKEEGIETNKQKIQIKVRLCGRDRGENRKEKQ